MTSVLSGHPDTHVAAGDPPVKTRRKLIEVALPLEAINEHSAREKSIRHGHPSTLHLWWSRKPTATARAVIFAQMVDDPAEYVDELLADPATRARAEKALEGRLAVWTREYALEREVGEKPTLALVAADLERQRLHHLIAQLVVWENSTNEALLEEARAEIWRSWRRACADNADHPRAAELFDPRRLPGFHDPFAGGGALPLEAQRLGLEAWGTDLNPVAVLINKAMIEIPPRFAGRAPVHPDSRNAPALLAREWRGAQGVADDVRHYGRWMREEAMRRIGALYPRVAVTAAMARHRPDLQPLVGEELTVIAWKWVRTVRSPNPALAHVEVPLAPSWWMCSKPGKEAWVDPVVEGDAYRFEVRVGKPGDGERVKGGTTAGKRAAFTCLLSGTPVSYDYIRAEGKAGRMGARLMAIVAEGTRGRVYLSPTREHEAVAGEARPEWCPALPLPNNTRDFKTPLYGLTTYGDLFTPRQLVALTTFSDLVGEAIARVRADAVAAGVPDDDVPLRDGGRGARAYAEGVGVYLAFGVDRSADRGSTICGWDNTRESIRNTFGRQAIPMNWDFAESNPFSESSGSFVSGVDYAAGCVEVAPAHPFGGAAQCDAATQEKSRDRVVATDPPYYDNIGYADLSDYFYVWLRRSLYGLYPALLGTIAVPKTEELVATPYRHGGKQEAERYFLEGMTEAMHAIGTGAHASGPVCIFYAFKQSETATNDEVRNSGWETFLSAVNEAGLSVVGTWPMRTEMSNRMVGRDTNALASSIVLVCRARPAHAPNATRKEFVTALRRELPPQLRLLQTGNVAPVDLAQAAIGPGMAIFSRYARVTDASGRPVTVRDALAEINQALDELLAAQDAEYDAETRFAIGWFDEYGFGEGDFGDANTLAQARATAVNALAASGIVVAARGKVRLLRPDELPSDWDPDTHPRLTAWEVTHHLVRVHGAHGEGGAARLMKSLGPRADLGRELAFRLYSICERRKRSAEAQRYNALVQAWSAIAWQAQEQGSAPALPLQPSFLSSLER